MSSNICRRTGLECVSAVWCDKANTVLEDAVPVIISACPDKTPAEVQRPLHRNLVNLGKMFRSHLRPETSDGVTDVCLADVFGSKLTSVAPPVSLAEGFSVLFGQVIDSTKFDLSQPDPSVVSLEGLSELDGQEYLGVVTLEETMDPVTLYETDNTDVLDPEQQVQIEYWRAVEDTAKIMAICRSELDS